MFLGEYQHSLDAKGRIILPAKFRSRLEQGCVVTRGRDGCLTVFTREGFEQLAERVNELRLSSKQMRDAARVIFAGASEQVPDSQGRVTIPENLRRYAGLTKDVMVAGAGERFEIWDLSRWSGHMAPAEREFGEIADAHPDFPL